jgi:transposase
MDYWGKERNRQKIYNKRTRVERTFSRLKEHLNLENLIVMGAMKVKTHVLLSCISLIAGKLEVDRLNQTQDRAAALQKEYYKKIFLLSRDKYTHF